MKLTEPCTITEALLLASSIAEPAPGEPAAWASGGGYVVSNKVIHAHRIYECVKDVAGRNQTPPPQAADLWLDTGPTARWAMFALDRNTPSQSDAPIEIKLKLARRYDTVGLFGVKGRRVILTMHDSAGQQVYRHEASMVRRLSTRWTDYFFGGFDAAQLPSLLRFDLPPVAGGTLTVRIEGGAGPFACSALVVGKSYFIGCAQYNAQSDALNFSRMDRREDGTSVLIPRRNVPRLDLQVQADAPLTPLIYALRARLLGRVCIWSGLDDRHEHPYFEPVLVLGFARRWLLDLAYPTLVNQTLELEDI